MTGQARDRRREDVAKASETIRVTYRLGTPGGNEALAVKIASDQSSGAFTELPGETGEVRARCAARVESIAPLEPAATPSFPDPGGEGPFHRADVVIAYPREAVGTDITALMTITVNGAYAVRGMTGRG